MAAAAELGLFSGLNPTFKKLPIQKPSSSPLYTPKKKALNFTISANLGGGEEELNKGGGGKKKFITKEQEPDQYWQTAGEKEGENPMKTPLPYIIIFAQQHQKRNMACCPCVDFSQGSRTWLAAALLVIPVFAVFSARLIPSSTLLLSIPLSLLLILFSTLFIVNNNKQQQKPNILQENTRRTTPTTTVSSSQSQDLYSENESLDPCSSEEEEDHLSDMEFSSQDKPQPDGENTETALVDSCELPSPIQSKTDELGQKNEGFSIGSRDSFSESESLDHCSTSSSEEDHYHSSDIEWIYNMGQRLDCSDDSISDEESLIEIAIPSGQFVYPSEKKKKDYDPKMKLRRCKLFADMNENEMNEEDNLIEIDIYMGSIKGSRF